ncbi:hypothetical protein Salat_1200300 [Sesamum alatum]|uniref:Uncharacterized protein n=1 Tax=Sesamum alatum TaxID=300844 RepID=A0AAE2CNS5_9LAMI|nr:hypothetical protein Salat_1200300 [Sesamum alatum]
MDQPYYGSGRGNWEKNKRLGVEEEIGNFGRKLGLGFEGGDNRRETAAITASSSDGDSTAEGGDDDSSGRGDAGSERRCSSPASWITLGDRRRAVMAGDEQLVRGWRK